MTDPEKRSPEGLHRGMNQRQLSMMSISGAIGVGLFLRSSVTIRLAGPGVIVLTFSERWSR